MKGVVNVINQISDLLAEDKAPGDDDDVLAYDEATIIVGTINASQGENASFVSQQGGVSLPSANNLFPNGTPNCLDQKVSPGTQSALVFAHIILQF